jgi:hypothetical protein
MENDKPDFEPIKEACSHLIFAIRLKSGSSGLMCTCEEDVAAGCIPNGVCPLRKEWEAAINAEMKKAGE